MEDPPVEEKKLPLKPKPVKKAPMTPQPVLNEPYKEQSNNLVIQSREYQNKNVFDELP